MVSGCKQCHFGAGLSTASHFWECTSNGILLSQPPPTRWRALQMSSANLRHTPVRLQKPPVSRMQ